METQITKRKKQNNPDYLLGAINIFLLLMLILSISYNQIVIAKTSEKIGTGPDLFTKVLSLRATSDKRDTGDKSLDNVDINSISSTAQAIAAVFPLQGLTKIEDIMGVMIATGTPDYGQAMGVTYDDPEGSMNKMAGAYEALKKQTKEEKPDVWQRYLKLAAAPRGISCEFCCGVGPQAVDAEGNSKCGCKHNPALQTVTLWLMQNTDYNDAQILKEAMRWKALWFPKDMVGIAAKISGGDTKVLEDLPSMVGGC